MNGREVGARLRRHRRGVVSLGSLGTAAIMLLASACGSSGGNTATSPGTSAATMAPTSPAPTGTPYVIGQVGTFSGSYASSNIGAHDGLDAWVKYTNSHGGINGHPVQVIQKDDQLNAALAQSEVKELVEQDHVMAIVGVSSIVEDSFASYISAGTTPVIGDDLSKSTTESDKNFFPQGTTRSVGYFYAMPKVAASQGKTKYGIIYCAESTSCSQISDNQKQQATAAGVNIVYTGSASATAPSYASQCLAAKQAGAEAIGMLLNPLVAGRVATACAQQGYHPQFLQAANGFSQKNASNAALEGDIGPVPVFPWFASDTPAEQTFQAAMRAYEPDDFNGKNPDGYSGAAAQAWASAEIFKAAATTLPPGQATGQDVINALYALPKNNTFGGLTPPISYNSTGPQAVNCFFTIQLKDGKYTTANNGQTVCKS